MAQIQATFDLIASGQGLCPKELWIDLGLIPSGKQVWLGYATLVAEDKDIQFEVRSNLAGQSAGTAGATQLHDYASAQVGASCDRDFFKDGNVLTATVVSTGVEHWWLRCRSASINNGAADYIFYYAIY
jgi:hypothetical protein